MPTLVSEECLRDDSGQTKASGSICQVGFVLRRTVVVRKRKGLMVVPAFVGG